MQQRSKRSRFFSLPLVLLLAALVPAIGVLCYTLQSPDADAFGGRSQASATKAEGASEEVREDVASGAHLEKKLTLLRAQQNALHSEISGLEERVATAEARREQAAPDELSAEEASLLAEEYSQSQLELLQKTIEEEPIDHDWAPTANEDLGDRLVRTDVVRSAKPQCGATLCRVEVEFAENGNSMQNAQTVAQNLPWNGAIHMRVAADGSRGTLYLSREGHDLPRMAMR